MLKLSVGLMKCAVLLGLLQACASVPMASAEQDARSKSFAAPPAGQASLYIFQNSSWYLSGEREIHLDGALIGAMAGETYLHRIVPPGQHTLTCESEFGDVHLSFKAEAGKLCFIRQYFTFGWFVSAARLAQVSEVEGKG